MDIKTVRTNLLNAVEEYLSTPLAWEDALIAINTKTGEVELVEEEEAESLPEYMDEYDIMEFVQMTPEGKWIPDKEAIDSVEL